MEVRRAKLHPGFPGFRGFGLRLIGNDWGVYVGVLLIGSAWAGLHRVESVAQGGERPNPLSLETAHSAADSGWEPHGPPLLEAQDNSARGCPGEFAGGSIDQPNQDAGRAGKAGFFPEAEPTHLQIGVSNNDLAERVQRLLAGVAEVKSVQVPQGDQPASPTRYQDVQQWLLFIWDPADGDGRESWWRDRLAQQGVGLQPLASPDRWQARRSREQAEWYELERVYRALWQALPTLRPLLENRLLQERRRAVLTYSRGLRPAD